MRKMLLTVVASSALLAFAPASALAQGRHHHHHRSHHSRFHHRTFGSAQSGTSTTPSPSAGTVQSFTGGVLTIALSNGSTVSGQVSDFTRIICLAAPSTGTQSTGSWRDHHDWSGGNDQSQGDEGSFGQSCSTSSLTTGAVVQAAELTISGAGATWNKVVLAPPASSSTTSSSTSSSSTTS